MPTASQQPSTRRRAASLLAVATLGSALAAAPALAGSFEQVSRDTGAQGSAPLGISALGFGVGDSGRYSVLYGSVAGPSAETVTVVRDIVSNTTTQIAEPGDVPVSVDRSETKLLVKRGGGLAIVPTSGVGPDRVIATGEGEPVESAVLSGDGNTVAYTRGFEPGVTVVTVSTGAHRVIDTPGPTTLGPRSLSDNGKVLVAGTTAFTGSRTIDLADGGVVSPDGRVILSHARSAEGFRSGLQITTVATGATRTVADPVDASGSIQWISPDGKKAYVGYDFEGVRVLSTATGRWSKLSTPYAANLRADLVAPENGAGAYSRNGRFAIVPFGPTVSRNWAVVSVAGRDLPGAQEPLSGTAYVFTSAPFLGCDEQSIAINLADPGLGVKPARSGTVSVIADGTPVVTGRPLLRFGDESDTGIELPAGTQQFTVQLRVVDGSGRTLTRRETMSPYRFPWCS